MTDKILIDRSVVEQALSTLAGWGNYDKWVWHESALSTAKKNTAEMITALRAALGQPQVEQEPVAWIENIGGGIGYNPYHDAASKLPDGVLFDLYVHPQACRQSLGDDEIRAGLHEAIEYATQYERAAFIKGVKFAERAHGITGEQA